MRLHDRHPRTHSTAQPVDRVHHLRHAVPTGLRREATHERAIQQPADHRGSDDEPTAHAQQRVARTLDGAVVGVPGEQAGDAEDHVAKRDRPGTRACIAGGSYVAITPARLTQHEPTITTTKKNDDAYVSAVKATATTYALTVTSVATGDTFVLTRSPAGITTRSCKIPTKTSAHGGCESITGTAGTW
jgi:hypothetical protein